MESYCTSITKTLMVPLPTQTNVVPVCPRSSIIPCAPLQISLNAAFNPLQLDEDNEINKLLTL